MRIAEYRSPAARPTEQEGWRFVYPFTAAGRRPPDLLSGAERRVGELAHAPVHTAAPGEDLAAAAARLRDRRVNALPVVDGDRLVGMLTTSGCLQVLGDPQLAAELAGADREAGS